MCVNIWKPVCQELFISCIIVTLHENILYFRAGSVIVDVQKVFEHKVSDALKAEIANVISEYIKKHGGLYINGQLVRVLGPLQVYCINPKTGHTQKCK